MCYQYLVNKALCGYGLDWMVQEHAKLGLPARVDFVQVVRVINKVSQ